MRQRNDCTCPGGWDEGEWSPTAGYDQECPIHGWTDGDGPILTPATA